MGKRTIRMQPDVRRVGQDEGVLCKPLGDLGGGGRARGGGEGAGGGGEGVAGVEWARVEVR